MRRNDNHIVLYSNQVRVRVCGLLVEEGKLLMVKHSGLGSNGTIWIPPGGGVEFGEKLEDALCREFMEETGLVVEVQKFLFINQFVEPPLHELEFFFEVKRTYGNLLVGKDPELLEAAQLITDVRFISWKDLKAKPSSDLHSCINIADSLEALLRFSGLVI